MIDEDNPVCLRERAAAYDQIALRISDDQALKALRDMARDYRNRADDIIERATVAASQRGHRYR
jgi:hypothetical protein